VRVSERTVLGACPLNCPDGCSWVATAVDGMPQTLRGNPDHPFTRGHRCVKVNPYLEYVKRPDRLLHPLRRVGAKGEGRFEQASADEALGEIAHRLHEVVETYGGEAIWRYAGTGTVGWIQSIVGAGKRLFHALGASRHAPTICSVAGHVGMSYTTGTAAGMAPEDLAHSRLVLLWGTNTLTSNQHLWHHVRAAQQGGADLIVVDPMQTKTAKRGDRHIAPKPGTDAALALGVMAHLVQQREHDEEFLAERTPGWDEFERSVISAWSPGRAASVCGIGEAEVVEFADAIARSRPTASARSWACNATAAAVRRCACCPASPRSPATTCVAAVACATRPAPRTRSTPMRCAGPIYSRAARSDRWR
jgi:anaerobic selenocysteine-containing dehydrogenase